MADRINPEESLFRPRRVEILTRMNSIIMLAGLIAVGDLAITRITTATRLPGGTGQTDQDLPNRFESEPGGLETGRRRRESARRNV